jgi:hypothetical protein
MVVLEEEGRFECGGQGLTPLPAEHLGPSGISNIAYRVNLRV